ncbi:MAG: hypothetical protein IKI50_01585 [Clostridia bacterium]|nr:hypothetical protein [Clostridia bacterium]
MRVISRRLLTITAKTFCGAACTARALFLLRRTPGAMSSPEKLPVGSAAFFSNDDSFIRRHAIGASSNVFAAVDVIQPSCVICGLLTAKREKLLFRALQRLLRSIPASPAPDRQKADSPVSGCLQADQTLFFFIRTYVLIKKGLYFFIKIWHTIFVTIQNMRGDNSA